MPDVNFVPGTIGFSAQTRIQLLCQKDPNVWQFYNALVVRVAIGLSLSLSVSGKAKVVGSASITQSTILSYSKSVFGTLNSNLLNSLIKLVISPLKSIVNSVLSKGFDLNAIIS